MTSTLKDFKKAYRQKALLYHPDRVPLEEKEESTAKFREVREAFEVLSSVRQKIRYDYSLGIDEERAEARKKAHREREETKTEENDVESNRNNNNNDDDATTPSDFNKNTFAKKKKTHHHKWKNNNANFEGTTPSEFNKNTFAKKKKARHYKGKNNNANTAPNFEATTPSEFNKNAFADREKVLDPKFCFVFPRKMTGADAAKIGAIIVAVAGFTCLIIYT